MAYLLIGSQTFFLDRKSEYLIGRHEACDIPVDGLYVSRHHAAIRIDGESFSIADLNSRNGTFFDNQRVMAKTLANGDRFRIGEVWFSFHNGTPEHMQAEFSTIVGS